jgi:3'-phosphoadenosine 5'-phosphosulfate sulfotransferase (PAPS reductase)/FAD synthetase
MHERWRSAFLTWASQPGYQRYVALAQQEVRLALERSRRPIVSFSGGKDSTAMLHLVLAERPDIEVLHWDYGPFFVPRPIEEEILRLARRLGAQRLRVETSPLYVRLGRRARNVLGRHLIGRLLPQLMAEGYDCCFVGLREQESLKRRRRMRAGRAVGPLRECWPLAPWSWLDVWAYIVSHGLPYLSLYDAAAAIVGYDQARWTTMHDPEFAHRAGATDGVLWWRWRHGQA